MTAPTPAAVPLDRAAGGVEARRAAAPSWTEDAVRARVAEALQTLRRLRLPKGAFPARLRSTLPLPVAEASDAVPDAPQTRPSPPSAAAIQRMDETLPWLYRVGDPRRRQALCLRAMGLSWRRVARAVGVASPETARAWEAGAVGDILKGLKAPVPR